MLTVQASTPPGLIELSRAFVPGVKPFSTWDAEPAFDTDAPSTETDHEVGAKTESLAEKTWASAVIAVPKAATATARRLWTHPGRSNEFSSEVMWAPEWGGNAYKPPRAD